MSDKQIALITGANRGIGMAILKTLSESGCIVIGTSRSEAGVKVINELIGDKDKGCGLVLDVKSQDDISKANKIIKETYGPVTILVNNAGITMDNLLLRMSNEEWSDVIETNLNSIYKVT